MVYEKSLVKALYLENASLQEHQAVVTDLGECVIKNKAYWWIELNETIFHPQGGGQPSDKGTIDSLEIDFVAKEVKGSIDKFEIKHCFLQKTPFKIGQKVALKLNWPVRLVNMRMHTAGHFIAHFLHQNFNHLIPVSGNHSPEDGYIKFKVNSGDFPTPEEIKTKFEESYFDALKNGLDCKVEEIQGTRQLKIGNVPGVPCGGTHLTSVKEIEGFRLGDIKINKKEESITVRYSLL